MQEDEMDPFVDEEELDTPDFEDTEDLSLDDPTIRRQIGEEDVIDELENPVYLGIEEE